MLTGTCMTSQQNGCCCWARAMHWMDPFNCDVFVWHVGSTWRDCHILTALPWRTRLYGNWCLGQYGRLD